MKAAIHTQYGPPEVVQILEIDKPSPAANEVLMRVHASTVNRTDCGFRSAEYFISRFFSGLFKPKQQILGCEFSGTVESVGESVQNYKTGDRVFGFNDSRFGGHAEYLIRDENDAMTLMPKNLSFTEAAALTEGAHYALCDIRAAKVEAGQKTMVYGATGAIGSAAVQLLKYFGTEVTAICNTPNMDLVRSLGADQVIDYTNEDFTKTNQRYDFIFDAVGKSSFGACRKLLKENGVYISTEPGKNGENIWMALYGLLHKGKRVLFPLPYINIEDVVFLKDLAESGKFKPLIDRIYPLDKIVEAYQYVESRQKIGNVVLSNTVESEEVS
jgi:NADPH:quinone reductase-like Zn-dependent oxidoreductase